MDGRQKPDPQPENINGLNDDEIIDLTQIFEGGDDDDIIDLNEILEQPDQALDAADEPDEAVIPLVDAIPTKETADLPEDTPEDTDDGIIDLMDMAPPPVPDEEISTAFVDEADDAVINLLDAVEPETAVTEDNEFADLENRAEAMLADTTDSETESGEKPFDVDIHEEATPTAGPDDDFMVLEKDETITDEGEVPAVADDQPQVITDIPEPIAGLMPDGTEPVVAEAVMDEPEPVAESIAEAPLVPPSPPEAEPIALTEAQVEAALERVIEKTYGEKIEQLMIQIIEKTVKREIEKIKNALIEDSDPRVG